MLYVYFNCFKTWLYMKKSKKKTFKVVNQGCL